jgi:hypothetical protein
MKKLLSYNLYLLCISAVMLALSCASLLEAVDDVNILGLPKVKDADGTYLGRASGFSGYSINILTDEGYFYNLKWDASLDNNGFYFESTDCSGAPYMNNTNTYSTKQLFHKEGTFYQPEGDDVSEIVTFSYQSNESVDNVTREVICNPDQTLTETQGFKLTTISRKNAGIPSTIKGPVEVYDTGE